MVCSQQDEQWLLPANGSEGWQWSIFPPHGDAPSLSETRVGWVEVVCCVCVCVCVLWEKGGKKNSLEHKIYVFDITAMHDGVNARG